MNNLDSRCPNIVSVEIHFNNFMEDIVRNYIELWRENYVNIDYNFKYDHGAKTFHSLLNNIHAKYLNDILNHYDGNSLLCDSMDEMVELFKDWVKQGLIIIVEEEEEETKFRKQTRIGECDGCKMICEECEPLVITDDEELEECDKCGYEDVSWCMSNKCQFQEECEKCDTTDNVEEYWWSEQANKRWLLCKSCGEKEGQIKCKY